MKAFCVTVNYMGSIDLQNSVNFCSHVQCTDLYFIGVSLFSFNASLPQIKAKQNTIKKVLQEENIYEEKHSGDLNV